MWISGLKMTNVWANRVLRERGIETEQAGDQPCQLGVLVDRVLLEHHGEEHSYRPYLRVSGRLTSVTPEAGTTWPYGVEKVTYSPGEGEIVDAFYEFDDQQLADLARKGYFHQGFDVPDTITGIEWELPATADVLVMGPARPDDVPVVFVGVHDAGQLPADLRTSGYDLTDYFVDQRHKPSVLTGLADPEAVPVSRSAELHDLFADEAAEVTSEPVEENQGTVEQTEEEESDLARRIAAARDDFDGEVRQAAQDLAAVPGTTENVYREKVGPVLEQEPERPSESGIVVRHRETSRFADAESDYEKAKRKVAEQAAALSRDAQDDALEL